MNNIAPGRHVLITIQWLVLAAALCNASCGSNEVKATSDVPAPSTGHFDSLERVREARRKKSDSLQLAWLDEAYANQKSKDSYGIFQFLHDTLPAKLFELHQLRHLSINQTYIRELPPAICNLKELVTLDIASNKISDFSHVTCLRNLVELKVWRNKITALPPNLDKLSQLNTFDLSMNDFSKGLSNKLPPSVVELYLRECDLKELPMEVLALENLRMLDISRNHGIVINDNIQKLKNLQRLRITQTELSYSRIVQLKQLLPDCYIEHD
ncbi:MAG TPA: leucine-rich repeat domain-containing protein [Chryseosolibacter sp.]